MISEKRWLQWFRHPRSGRFCRFSLIDPEIAGNTVGVVVVWRETGGTVYVGHGKVADQIVELRKTIGRQESLLVSWAKATPGVARYLVDTLNPQIPTGPFGERAVPVNRPGL